MYSDSPVSNNGRGLKPRGTRRLRKDIRDSPVSNNGRGLKRASPSGYPARWGDSPVSNNGRGLKHFGGLLRVGGRDGFAR